jgi:hypothetical protein
MEFREHAGCEDARAKFREWEERAAEVIPRDRKQVAREVVNGTWAAVADLAPTLPEALREQVRKTLFGMIPVVGKFGQVLGCHGGDRQGHRVPANLAGRRDGTSRSRDVVHCCAGAK